MLDALTYGAVAVAFLAASALVLYVIPLSLDQIDDD